MKYTRLILSLAASAFSVTVCCSKPEPTPAPGPDKPDTPEQPVDEDVAGLSIKATLSSGGIWDHYSTLGLYSAAGKVDESVLGPGDGAKPEVTFNFKSTFKKGTSVDVFTPSDAPVDIPADQKQDAAGMNVSSKYAWAFAKDVKIDAAEMALTMTQVPAVVKILVSTTELNDFKLKSVTLRSASALCGSYTADLAARTIKAGVGIKNVKVSLGTATPLASEQAVWAVMLPGKYSDLVADVELQGTYKGVENSIVTLSSAIPEMEIGGFGAKNEIKISGLETEGGVELLAPSFSVRVDDEFTLTPYFSTSKVAAGNFSYTLSDPSVFSYVTEGKNIRLKALKEGNCDVTIRSDSDPALISTAKLSVKKKAVRILAIGNSFSQDAVEQYLWELFDAAGINAVIGNLYHGGCSLQMHWNYLPGRALEYSYRKVENGVKNQYDSVSGDRGIKDEMWDYISFQQGAGLYGNYASFFPYLENVIDYCRKNAPNANFKTIYHATWAAAKNSTNSHFINYFNSDQMYMYTATNDVLKQIDDVFHFDVIANSIDGVQNGRTSYLGDTFNRDGWHLNNTYGRYTASCVWFEKISGIDVTTNTYHPATITKDVADVCRIAAHQACLHPSTITDLSYIKEPQPGDGGDDSGDDKGTVLASWVFDKARAVSDGYKETYTSAETALGTYIYSNAPGEVGYIMANGSGNGKLSYVQIDKTAYTGDKQKAGRYILNGTPGGQPAVCGQMAGDYWLFETLGRSFSAGDKLSMSFTVHPGNYGAKYWRVEYLDGSEWKPAIETRTVEVGGVNISFNAEMPTNAKYDISFTVTLSAATEAFKVRLVCCSTYQVNAKIFDNPNTPSVFRIAGTEADNNLPVMKLL